MIKPFWLSITCNHTLPANRKLPARLGLIPIVLNHCQERLIVFATILAKISINRHFLRSLCINVAEHLVTN